MEDCADKRSKIRLERNAGQSHALPRIEGPNIVGFYSTNSNFEFMDDSSQLRYLTFPLTKNVKFDLKSNSQNMIRKKRSENEIKIDCFLKWINAHRSEFGSTRVKEIVSSRGSLIKVMSSPYESQEGWIICASKFQGKIYLCKYDTPEKVRYEQNRTRREKDFADWGSVFERHLVSDDPGRLPNLNVATDQNESFSCVFRTKIAHHNLIYFGEMDGLKIDDTGNVPEPIRSFTKLKELLDKKGAEFMELKTAFPPKRHQWEYFWRFRSLRWWTQCFMSDIRKVICGFRDNNGIVNGLEVFPVKDLPKKGQRYWDQAVCLSYCIRFLDVVTNHVSNGPDKVMWSFTWNPLEPDYLEVKCCDNDSQYHFLHKWFTDEFEKGIKRKSDSSESTVGEMSGSKIQRKT